MKNRQKAAMIVPLVLIATMYLVFQLLSRALGETLGWYLGLVLYWLIWCAAFPLWIIGKDNLRRIIQPRRLERRIVFLMTIPIVGAATYKLIPGMNYSQASIWSCIMMILTAFGNGFFEETLWRGVYMELFPDSLFFRIFWPSVWFALWHFAPGSVLTNGNVIALMIGSGVFGFYLSFLAKKTNTIWWSIVAHTIGGVIMVL